MNHALPKASAASRAATLWLTGLSGAGKSTLAAALAEQFRARGVPHLCLDGDAVRAGLCSDLGFSAADRQENIRRVAEVARLLNDAGLTVICALISPLRLDRERARSIIGCAHFLEVHISTPLAACEERDPKGLYRRARRLEIPDFTGISAPYEAPGAPALSIDCSQTPVEQAVTRLLALWSAHCLLNDYS